MGLVIQYIWVKKYKCLKNYEVNFTNRVKFHYNEELHQIECLETNLNYIESFHSKQIDITCVVGRNGAGKTTLLRLIKDVFTRRYGRFPDDCIAISFDGTKYYADYLFSEEGLRLGSTYNNLEISNIKEYHAAERTRCIYYSAHLDQFHYSQPRGNDDLSTPKLLYKTKSGDEKSGHDRVVLFFQEEFNKQITFIQSFSEQIKSFSLRYPPFVTASFLFEEKFFNEWCRKKWGDILDSGDWTYIIMRFLTIHAENNIEAFREYCAKALFLNAIYRIGYTVDQPDISLLNHMLHSGQKTVFQSVQTFFEDETFWGDPQNLIMQPYRDKYLRFLEYIDSLSNEMTKINPLYPFPTHSDPFFIIPTEIRSTVEEDLPKDSIPHDIQQFFSEYKEVADFHDFLYFSWGLSSGEQSFLNIMARLYSKCAYDEKTGTHYLFDTDQGEKSEDDAILLLDEIDDYLHPKWQSQLIESLIQFIESVYSTTHVHIILTTHSPIMLSDVPKQNTVLVGGEQSQFDETFAANIYSLYNRSFFLNDGCVGSFAAQVIQDLTEKIEDYKPENDKWIEERLTIIGDKFMRSFLTREYLKQKRKYSLPEQSMTESELIQRIHQLEQENQRLSEENANLKDT